MRPAGRVAAVLLLSALLAAGCAGAKPKATGPPRTAPVPKVVYVAVGASETVGIGSEDPLNDAWPQVLFRRYLPLGTVLENFGIPGATTADALGREVPDAVGQSPALATVWLNVNDITRAVPVATYEQQLGEVVHGLRRGGATKVLVANTPPLDHLPGFLACLPNPPPGVRCVAAAPLTSAAAVDATVDAYNAAIARVVRAEGAVLVDLHAAGLAARADGTEDTLVAGDGFHPSTAGHAAVAARFGDALA
jgi:lysophospholipase L1-like esterase